METDPADRLAATIDSLASAVEGNTSVMKALRDAIDDLRSSYEHAVRNAGCSYRADHIPETIACAHCDVDSPDSLAAALQQGWTSLCRDDGPGWNYLGVCAECQARQNAVPETEALQPDDQKRFSP